MQKELVALFSRVHIPAALAEQAGVHHARALNAEIGTLGYSLDGKALERLARCAPEDFSLLRDELLHVLRENAGGHVDHNALFNGFPYETPDLWDYLVRRLIGYVQNLDGAQSNQVQVLSCGHVIDFRLFDLKDFGACPICQQQTAETAPQDEAKYRFSSVTPLKLLAPADDDFIRQQASILLGRQGSLSTQERSFLSAARVLGGLTRPEKVFRENLPFIYSYFADLDYVRSLSAGATDVLRIAAYLSEPDADLSLKESVKFKISTRHKKRLLNLLEGMPRLDQDLLRHRERWLRLGERLNPGTAANRQRFPRVAEAFDRLRNAPNSIPNFNRQVETALRAHAIDSNLIDLLVSHPGEFFRRLDHLLRISPDPGIVLAGLEKAAARVPTRPLFEMRKYLTWRRLAEGPRVFIPKGRETKIQIVEDRRAIIPEAAMETAAQSLDRELSKRLCKLPPMGSVYLDPALKKVVLPFNRRGDSASSTAVGKGSRVPLGNPPVVRLFVWWKGDRVDVDLSMTVFNDDFVPMTTISFKNLHTADCFHSGDVQSAPDGASEFIDFSPETLTETGARYVVSSVIAYKGGTLDSYPCFAGFMKRDELRSGLKYEPESVTLKFDIQSRTTSNMPLIFDLKTDEVIFADIAASQKSFLTMSDNKRFAALAQAVLDLPRRKLTAHDVLEAHARARGGLAESAAMAETTFISGEIDLDEIGRMAEPIMTCQSRG